MIGKKLNKHLANCWGWRSKRKFIVIESDDWGSIRMPSLATYEKLKTAGIDVSSGDSRRYNKNDTLASGEDLKALFEVLRRFRDQRGNAPVFTAISLTSNPDFAKIESSDFAAYYHEPFTCTLERYGRAEVWKYWEEGRQDHIFVPEFHGREHLNVAAWMRALRANDRHARLAFEAGVWGYKNQTAVQPVKFQAAFALEHPDDLEIQKNILSEGLRLFEKLHGRPARVFVPPNGPLHNDLEPIAAQGGIQYISTAKLHRAASVGGKASPEFRYLGKQNSYGQTYLTRNCFFEPSKSGSSAVKQCLEDIEIAFKWRKPAVISTHRVNFIGGNIASNREQGLEALGKLLGQILQRWPGVEFLSSNQLGDEITGLKSRV